MINAGFILEHSFVGFLQFQKKMPHKINGLFGSDKRKESEAIVNKSGVKTVRKLQLLLSLQLTVNKNTAIQQRFLNLLSASVNSYIYCRGKDYTAHAKQQEKNTNELSVFLKTSFFLVKMPKNVNAFRVII